MKVTQKQGKEGLRILLTIASAVVITAGIKEGRDILVPIVLAGFLAIVSYPFTSFCKSKLRFPHWLAVTFTVLMDFAVLLGFYKLACFLGQDLTNTITTKYQPLVVDKLHEFRVFLVQHNWNDVADQMLDNVPALFDSQKIVAFSTGIMGNLLSMLTFFTLILILMTFFLGEAPRFRTNINKLGKSEGDSGIKNFSKALANVQKYLIIKTFISAMTGALAFLLCYFVGVDFPLLWGVTAFALNYIPTFGSIIAAIPPILLALLLISPTMAVVVAAGYLVINTALGSILEPCLLGRQFGIVTSMILLSVIYWGWVWGPIGMLLAVPITMLVKLGLESSKDLSWIAKLIDNPPVPKFPIHSLQSIQSDEDSHSSI